MSEWQHGLFGCFDNIKITVITYLVPCYTMGKIAESVGESCIMHGVVWPMVPVASIICPVQIRGKVREAKGLEGSFIMDCAMLMCCQLCALVQEYQEMGIEGMARN